MKKKFKRDISSLENIFKFLEDFEVNNKLDQSVSFAINLAVEELFTNMVKYRTDNPEDILIMLSMKANQVIVVLTEYQVEPFDINKTQAYDPTQPLAVRHAGGVGIHLVKKIIDKIDYQYQNGTSKITLIKHLEKIYVRDKN
jgi:serine/threonine-protein kinase RsbW